MFYNYCKIYEISVPFNFDYIIIKKFVFYKKIIPTKLLIKKLFKE